MGWTPDYAQEVARSINNHLADLPPLHAAKLDVRTIANVLRPIESSRVSMGKKVRQRGRAILDHAVADGLMPLNPIPVTRRGKAGARRNYPAIVERDGIGSILCDARKADVCRDIKRAHELIALTAQRSGEIVPAKWGEFDLKAALWRIPRERMKMKDEKRPPHPVPLPPRLLALLKLWRLEDGTAAVYVCPAPRSKGHVTADALSATTRRRTARTDTSR